MTAPRGVKASRELGEHGVDVDRLADALAARMTRPILADTRTAAAMLGMGVDAFRAHVAPHVGCVRRGTAGKGQGRALRLYRVADLERWADEHATRIVDELARPEAT